MYARPRSKHLALPALLFTALLAASPAIAQPHAPVASLTPDSRSAPMATEKDLEIIQSQLIKLLRESPTLTTVVEHDPSLLANQEYVRRNNPQLAQFLDSHPEIALNPDYYLFTHLNGDGEPSQALDKAVWPELQHRDQSDSIAGRIVENLVPFLVFLCICGVVLWLVRVFLENRRWNRIFKLQVDVHGRLIDKFGSNQELLTYMDTEAGKRFLEAAPLAVNFDAGQGSPRISSAVARVLTPLQIGTVLTLLGSGLLLIRHAHPDLEIPLLIFGTLVLMPGIGFILSAGLTWMLAGRLGLMPKHSENLHAYDNTLTPRERQ
jgi:hypothetical protein